MRPSPELSASGGQVIGSTATARPRPTRSRRGEHLHVAEHGIGPQLGGAVGRGEAVAHVGVAVGGRGAAERVVEVELLHRTAGAEVERGGTAVAGPVGRPPSSGMDSAAWTVSTQSSVGVSPARR